MASPAPRSEPSSHIRVCVRVRPLSESEAAAASVEVVRALPDGRSVQAAVGDGLLSPLEAALVAEIRGNGSAVVIALGELKTEIREIRNNPPFRWVPWSMLLLWLLNMFVIAILAMERGVEPLRAAEAVKVLTPGITGEPMVEGTP